MNNKNGNQIKQKLQAIKWRHRARPETVHRNLNTGVRIPSHSIDVRPPEVTLPIRWKTDGRMDGPMLRLHVKKKVTHWPDPE